MYNVLIRHIYALPKSFAKMKTQLCATVTERGAASQLQARRFDLC